MVFGLSRSQNLAAHGVAAWNRSTGQLTTVRLLTAAEQNADRVIDFDPIVIGDTAYWIEQKYGDDAHQTLVNQSLPDGRRNTQPIAHVSRLVAVGTGVALLHAQMSAETRTLTAGPGLDPPAAVLAAGSGSWFGSDGTTLRWLDVRNGSALLRSWRPGSSLTTQSLANAPLTGQLAGPFLATAGGATIFDTRNGSTLRLPSGLLFPLATGGDLITVTGTTKFGAPTVHRVPLSALPPTPC